MTVVKIGSAVDQYLAMTSTAEGIGDALFKEHGGAGVGDMEFCEDSKLHFIPVIGMIHDIEVAKTHVWEDGRVEQVFGV